MSPGECDVDTFKASNCVSEMLMGKGSMLAH